VPRAGKLEQKHRSALGRGRTWRLRSANNNLYAARMSLYHSLPIRCNREAKSIPTTAARKVESLMGERAMNVTPKHKSKESSDANPPTHTNDRQHDFPSLGADARSWGRTKAKDHDPERHDPGQHKTNRELAKNIGAALEAATAQGRPFVLPWRVGADANHSHWQAEYQHGCGQGQVPTQIIRIGRPSISTVADAARSNGGGHNWGGCIADC
jgi:hypothetical protein